MSITTSSPAADRRGPGSAWGSAPFGPAATIGRKRRLRALLAHPGHGVGGHVGLGPADQAALECLCVDSIGEFGRGGDRGDLGGILDSTQILDHAAGIDQVAATTDGLGESAGSPHCDLVVFDPDPAGKVLPEAGEPLAGDNLHVPALQLGGTFGIPEVGKEGAPVGTNQTRRVGAGKTGQVLDVDEAR